MSEEQLTEPTIPTDTDRITDAVFERIGARPDQWALFLDIDGTLLDLALTPDEIVVPETLPDHLHQISDRMGGAMALVTGRALPYADALFRPHHFPLAGLHGAEMRAADGRMIFATPTPEFEAVKAALVREAENLPGVLIEDKGAAVAAHYRLAPQYEALLERRMRHYVQEAGPGWALQLGKMVFEIRPARASKGDAVERFMQEPPFTDRLPLAIGDDLTDESMFAVANARGGHSIRVGFAAATTCAQSRAVSPTYIRSALAMIAA
ncbi:trehalose-phosphatase [Rhizobium sp. LjRoot30]|uniref:trehalose-phosphatase n=1 Tax=Rhizobium sp. LjRoot30 TaxID=3342320 RepID=UPI003F4FD07A